MEIIGPLNYRDQRAAFPGVWSLWSGGLKWRNRDYTVHVAAVVSGRNEDQIWDEAEMKVSETHLGITLC
jgi:hypothetical protein